MQKAYQNQTEHLKFMSFKAQSIAFVLVIALILPAVVGSPSAARHPVQPQGSLQTAPALLPGDWNTIQTLIGQAEYQPTYHAADSTQPAGYYWAPNRAHGWRLVFTPQGLEVSASSGGAAGAGAPAWRWGLALQGYGCASGSLASAQAPAALDPALAAGRMQADQQRLTYYWDAQLSEWYLNSPQGLEHGFTIERRPDEQPGGACASSQPGGLSLELAILGDLQARQLDGAALEFSRGERPVLRYDKLLAYDAAGKTLPAELELLPGGESLRIHVDDRGARYPVTIDPLLTSELAHLTASDWVYGENFGGAISLSGDRLLVGASNDDNETVPAPNQGAAYLFARDQGGDGAWGQVIKLTAADSQANDQFGNSVSLSGDTALVGASYADVGGWPDQGAAYLFERNQGGTDAWGQSAKLAYPGIGEGKWFGSSTNLSASGGAGDLAIVGATRASTDLYSNLGAVFIFQRDLGGSNAWGLLKTLYDPEGSSLDFFGSYLALDGDTLLVSEPSDDLGTQMNQGSFLVYERNRGGADNWGFVKKVHDPDGQAGDQFGAPLAIHGDTILAGNILDDPGGVMNQGSALIFERDRGGEDAWGLAKRLVASDGAEADVFGTGVALVPSGEFGLIAAVGAFYDDVDGRVDQGSVYLFQRDWGGLNQWGPVARIIASDGAAGDNFGTGLNLGLTSQGELILAVGSSGDDLAELGEQGSLYLYLLEQHYQVYLPLAR